MSKRNMFEFLAEHQPGVAIVEPVAAAKPPKKTPKSKDPDWTKVGLYLKKDTHRRLGAQAKLTGVEISDILEGLAAAWVKSQKSY